MKTESGPIPIDTGNAAEVAVAAQRLAEPFDRDEVKFKPQSVKGNRALAMAYIDARCVMDRLDEVAGVAGWQDEYDLTPDGSTVCRLRVLLGGQWITKTDVGSPSEQPDGGDRLKASFSDALKRAAVKFGVGRYLYRLPAVWTDYDPQRKQFSSSPQLPAWATPRPRQSAPHAEQQQPAPPQKPAAPQSGAELYRRLKATQERMRGERRIGGGNDLIEALMEWGVDQGHGADIESWAGPSLAAGVAQAKEIVTHWPAAPAGAA